MPTRTPFPHARPAASRTPPTDAAHPRRQAPTPRTHVVAPAPAVDACRMIAPRVQARTKNTHRRMYARPAPETRFSAYGRRVRATLATRSRPVHMAWDREAWQLTPWRSSIGCLGVDRRVELFFSYLAIFSRETSLPTHSHRFSKGMAPIGEYNEVFFCDNNVLFNSIL